jgi:hypothetical protein
MAYAALTLKELPRIGFAHHLRVESYTHTPTRSENSLEIVYVKEGAIHVRVGEHRFVSPSGGIAVIPRNLPFAFETADGQPNQHCSVQLKMAYDVSLLEDSDRPSEDFGGLLLPLVLPPSPETETIKKDLYAIVSDMDLSRHERETAAAVTALGILGKVLRLPTTDYLGCILADAVFGIAPLIFYVTGLSQFVYLSLTSVAVSIIALVTLFIFHGREIRSDLARRFHI